MNDKEKDKLLVVVDVESDGPCPGLYSMVSFGAVVVEPSLDRTYYGKIAPLPGASWMPEALAISGTTREEHLHHRTPSVVMAEFRNWLLALGAKRLTFVSDNPVFDWQFINYYLHLFGKEFKDPNPFKDFRTTRHTHNPVDDAKGNAEALMKVMDMRLMARRLHPE